MKNQFLSIIIPTLNEEKYLPVLLSSLASQTDTRFEVIVSEAKSEDKTKEKALEFENRLDIKVHDSDKRNLSYQRNFGAKKAKGKYLVFLDADHWADNNFIELIKKKIEKTNADLIIPVSIPHTKKLFWRFYFGLVNFLIPFMLWLKKPMGNGPTVAIKREIFEKIGGFDESVYLYEDQYLFHLAQKHGVQIKYTNQAKVYFSIRRIENGGVLKYFWMNLYAGFHLVFIGPVRRKILEYEMGGHVKKK